MYRRTTEPIRKSQKLRKIKLELIFSSSENVSVVLFSADWAEQCSQILNVMNELAKQSEYKELQFINIPAEDYSEISLANKVTKFLLIVLHSILTENFNFR